MEPIMAQTVAQMGWNGHMGGMWFWSLLGLIAVVALVWLVVRIATRDRTGPPERRSESPEEVLKRRYANGEISRDEYERKLSDLQR